MNLRRFLGALGVALLAASAPVGASTDEARGMIADGRFESALEMLQAASPENVEARFLRGVVLAELDRAAEAEEVFRRLIFEYPEYPEPYNNLAVLLAESGRYDEAVETLKSALRTHDSYRTAWDNLTTIYGRLASEAYSRALNVESSSAGRPVRLAMLSSLSELERPALAPVETVAAGAMSATEEGPERFVPDEPVAFGPSQDEVSVAESTAPQEGTPDGSAGESGEQEDVRPESAQVKAGSQGAAGVESLTGEPGTAEVASASVAEEVEGETESATSESGVTTPAALTSVVEAWAESWSEQDTDEYLSFYSNDFEPSDEMELEEWKSLRRARIEAPEFIRVEIALLDVSLADEEAEVTFNQSYESNTFGDLVTKTLTLKREGDGWKITREVVAP